MKRLESLAHFLLLGVAAAYCLTGPVALVLFVVREFTDWTWVPWPFRGQWPPGNPKRIYKYTRLDLANNEGFIDTESIDRDLWTQMDRVNDLRRDSIETCLGIAVGTGLSMVWPWWELI